MFSGIVEQVGTIMVIGNQQDKRRITIRTSRRMVISLQPGSSISVEGICLTVVARKWLAGLFEVEATGATLEKSTAQNWQVATQVNLERAARIGMRNHGHTVQGHVGGLATVTQVEWVKDHLWLSCRLPSLLQDQVVTEGSIALSGVSLTIASIEGTDIKISIIPYTARHTTLGQLQRGDIINVESDIIGRYVVQTLQRYRDLG